jgi:hypothetical protein
MNTYARTASADFAGATIGARYEVMTVACLFALRKSAATDRCP